jgi:formylglycine-generating enzyme required for sulfatase activity
MRIRDMDKTDQILVHKPEVLVPAPDNNMVWIPGGTFKMGSEHFYPEERPVHEVRVDGFWMDRYAVTNSQFFRFVAETGYLTMAERVPAAKDYPGVPQECLVPGASVFHRTLGPVDPRNYTNWWSWVPGANWKNPFGPQSSNRRHRESPSGAYRR